jgi:hypothetical protein
MDHGFVKRKDKMLSELLKNFYSGADDVSSGVEHLLCMWEVLGSIYSHTKKNYSCDVKCSSFPFRLRERAERGG